MSACNLFVWACIFKIDDRSLHHLIEGKQEEFGNKVFTEEIIRVHYLRISVKREKYAPAGRKKTCLKMRKHILRLRLFLALLLLPAATVHASHLIGADLTYVATGVPNEYLFRLRLFRDCSTAQLGSLGKLNYASASLGICDTISMSVISTQIVPAGFCLSSQFGCAGNGIAEEVAMEVVLQLPGVANDWEFNWTGCCATGVSTIIPNSINTSCRLNNLVAPVNDSPFFTEADLYISQVGFPDSILLGATEADGDSLEYIYEIADDSYVCPGPISSVTYYSPYTYLNPFLNSPPVFFDSINAVLHFTPMAVSFTQIGVRVNEYRNGLLIGSVKRHLQVRAYPYFLHVLPAFEPQILKANNGFIAAQCGDDEVMLTFDTSFHCASAVPTDFRSLDPLGVPNPVIAVQPVGCRSGYADTLVLKFQNPLTIGITYLWVKNGIDGNTLISECGYALPELRDTVPVVVHNVPGYSAVYDTLPCYLTQHTLQLADPLLCWTVASDGSDLRLRDANGVVYPITAASVYCPGGTISSRLVLDVQLPLTVAQPLILYADSSGATDGNSIANRCGHFLMAMDTVAVLYLQTAIPVHLPSDTVLCADQPVPQLSCGPFPAVNYQWYQHGQSIPGATQAGLQPSSGGMYSVVVSGNGCEGRDSILLTIHPSPVVDLRDSTVCDGTPWPLLSAGSSAGLVYNWGYNNVFSFDDSLPVFQTSGQGMYSLWVVDSLGCTGIDSMILTRNVAPPCTIDPLTLCDGQAATLNSVFTGGSYLWSTGDTTAAVLVSTPGIYTLTVTYAGCSASDTAEVIVAGYPPAPVVSCGSGIAGYNDVYTWTPVPSAIFYQVSEDGGTTWIPANTPAGVTSHGVNNAPPAFVVRAIGSPPCDTGQVSVPTGCPLAIPNIITPNGDQINDFFEIRNIAQYPDCKVSIHNRWGQEMYQVSGYDNNQRRFDGASLPEGVYLFTVDLGNGTVVYRGTVAIYR